MFVSRRRRTQTHYNPRFRCATTPKKQSHPCARASTAQGCGFFFLCLASKAHESLHVGQDSKRYIFVLKTGVETPKSLKIIGENHHLSFVFERCLETYRFILFRSLPINFSAPNRCCICFYGKCNLAIFLFVCRVRQAEY